VLRHTAGLLDPEDEGNGSSYTTDDMARHSFGNGARIALPCDAVQIGKQVLTLRSDRLHPSAASI